MAGRWGHRAAILSYSPEPFDTSIFECLDLLITVPSVRLLALRTMSTAWLGLGCSLITA